MSIADPTVAALHLLVIAKEPVAGRVKTRLVPPYSHNEAARIAGAALADTLTVVSATPVAHRTVVLDGAPDGWVPSDFGVIPQRGSSLDERLAAAFDDAWAARPGYPLLLIGMDTPQVTPALLAAAGSALLDEAQDAVIGLAEDGGWWALGLRHPDPQVFLGVPMSTDHTGRDQIGRLRERSLRVGYLPELVDVDDATSATQVAAQAPGSRFAAVLDECLIPV